MHWSLEWRDRPGGIRGVEGSVMGDRIVTYQSPNGATISLTRRDVSALREAGVWPRDHRGAEYCTVSHGERWGSQSADDAAKVRETVGGAR